MALNDILQALHEFLIDLAVNSQLPGNHSTSGNVQFVILVQHVDDILRICNSCRAIRKSLDIFKLSLRSGLMRKLRNVLGFTVQVTVKSIKYHNTRMGQGLLLCPEMEAFEASKNPSQSEMNSNVNENETFEDSIHFRNPIGWVIYLANTRLDIAHAVIFPSYFMYKVA